MPEIKLLYQIGLTLIPGVGDVLARKIVTMCGSAEAVFREPRHILRKMPRIGEVLAAATTTSEILSRAEKEVSFIEKYRITPLFFMDKEYPDRLKHCLDGPVLLFYKGVADLNAARVIGMVGTRKATDYGKSVTREIIEGLLHQEVLVVSGLAYGIDSHAHRFALDYGLETIGVLGHGLDTVYPWVHRGLAERMVTQGGLVTEFLSRSKPDKCNFPRRNRVIAGMCDAIIVVEAGRKGGALITADIANSYNRDVFAVPGRLTDPYSDGTNYLIRTNKAALVQKSDDIEYLMGWKEHMETSKLVQRRIFIEMTEDEEKIVGLLQLNGQLGIDEIGSQTACSMSKVSAALLNLEFEGVVKCLPGKVYSLA